MLVDWLTNAQIWVIFGIVLVIIEVLAGGMFALPVGLSSLVMAALLFADGRYWLGDSMLLTGWEDILIVFALLTVVSIGALRFLLQRKDETDINKY